MNSMHFFVSTLPRALALIVGLGGLAGHASANELRVFLNETCIVADEPIVVPDASASKGLPIGGLIVSDTGQAVIRGVIRGLAWGLASISSRRDYSYTTAQDLYLYKVDYEFGPEPYLNTGLSCLTLVAGDFAPGNADCSGEYQPLILTDAELMNSSAMDVRSHRAASNVLRRANICVNREPDLLIENRVMLSDDHSAFRLQGAGRHINQFLSTDKKSAERGLLLTASLFAPAPDGRGRHLSTHWINYGMVSPEAPIAEYADDTASSWTPVPRMTEAILGKYLRDSAAHRTAFDKVAALELSILRNSRHASGLEEQLQGADPNSSSTLKEEIESLSDRINSQRAELDAWKREYSDLTVDIARYMPVTLEVTLTETRDEKRLLRVLATLLDANSRKIAKAIGGVGSRED